MSWEACLIKINANGKIDNNFGNNGKKIITRTGRQQDLTTIILPTNEIVFACHEYPSSDEPGLLTEGVAICKLSPTGEVITTFGQNGFISIENAYPSHLMRLTQGFVACGGIKDGKGWLVKISSSGTIESNFGQNGEVTIDYGVYNGISKSFPLKNDHLIVVGVVSLPSGQHETFFARLNQSGIIDQTFANNGFYTTAYNFGDGYFGPDIIDIQNDGKILTIGGAGDSTPNLIILSRFKMVDIVITIEPRLVLNLQLYPNIVSSDEKEIRFFLHDVAEVSQIIITDMTGFQYTMFPQRNNSFFLPQKLCNGYVVVQIVDKEWNIHLGKFLKI